MPAAGITQRSRQQPRASLAIAACLPGCEFLVHFLLRGEPVVELLTAAETAALGAPVRCFCDTCFATLRERGNLAALQLRRGDLCIRRGRLRGGCSSFFRPARAGARFCGHGVRLRGAILSGATTRKRSSKIALP